MNLHPTRPAFSVAVHVAASSFSSAYAVCHYMYIVKNVLLAPYAMCSTGDSMTGAKIMAVLLNCTVESLFLTIIAL